MPGDLWERCLVPSALIDEGAGLVREGRHAVIIDQPSSLADMVASARSFTAKPLPDDLSPEEYV